MPSDRSFGWSWTFFFSLFTASSTRLYVSLFLMKLVFFDLSDFSVPFDIFMVLFCHSVFFLFFLFFRLLLM